MSIEIYPEGQRARFFNPLAGLEAEQDDAVALVRATPIKDEADLYVQFSDCGQHIRRWSRDHFAGAHEFILA